MKFHNFFKSGCASILFGLLAMQGTVVDAEQSKWVTEQQLAELVDPALLPPPESPIDYPIEPVPPRRIHKKFRRQMVEFEGPEQPGTIVVDTPSRFLYLVEPGGTAMRYGVAIGRGDLYEPGTYTIKRKAEWPHWTPTRNMIRRARRSG